MRIALDFDGVLHAYTTPWTAPEVIHDGPVPGALEAVERLLDEGFDLIVVSSRALSASGHEAIVRWLHKHGFGALPVTGHKVPANLYVDDRGFRFDGDWDAVHRFLAKNPGLRSWSHAEKM